MSWEVAERRDGYTLWQGYNADGYRVYATTANREGEAGRHNLVEPTGANVYTSKGAAVHAHEEDARFAKEQALVDAHYAAELSEDAEDNDLREVTA